MAIPVTLADAKRQLHVDLDDTSQDEEIEGFIADAAAWVERYTGHILVARDVTQSFRGFSAVDLRAWPIARTAVPGVAHVDAGGLPVAVPGATLDLSARPARVLPPGGRFFTFRDTQQQFTVTVRAGYEADEPVPGNLRRAMLVLISAFSRDREGGEVMQKAEVTARSLCADYRARAL